MIIIKPGASIRACRAEILHALIISIAPIFDKYNVDTVVTSGSEMYKHTVKRSAHYRGDAVDLRSKHLSQQNKTAVLLELQTNLGDDFVVLLESANKPWEHYHVHWSPVYRSA